MSTTNPYAPPSAEVRDIDDSTLVVATRGSRLGAATIDTVLAVLMIYVPAVIAAVLLGGGIDPEALQTDPEAALMFYGGMFAGACVGAIPYFALTLYFVLKNSQTIGKKAVGIKVVRKDGSKCSFARIFWLRNVVNLVLNFVPLYGLIDTLLIFAEERQCIHDKLADTIVIKA